MSYRNDFSSLGFQLPLQVVQGLLWNPHQTLLGTIEIDDQEKDHRQDQYHYDQGNVIAFFGIARLHTYQKHGEQGHDEYAQQDSRGNPDIYTPDNAE